MFVISSYFFQSLIFGIAWILILTKRKSIKNTNYFIDKSIFVNKSYKRMS